MYEEGRRSASRAARSSREAKLSAPLAVKLANLMVLALGFAGMKVMERVTAAIASLRHEQLLKRRARRIIKSQRPK